MLPDVSLSRVFLILLAAIGIYTVVLHKSPEEITLIPCIFQTVTDVPCPGCGMTRACLALTQGNFAKAWFYHPFSFLVVGLAIGVAFFPLQVKNAWTRFPLKTRNLILIFGIVLCVSVWIFKIT